MAKAKQIKLKVINSKLANNYIINNHYSGKIVQNSILHFGVYLNNKLEGVMSYGPPINKRQVIGLVVDNSNTPAPWHDMLELNRMAFSDNLPKNSESRAIAISLKLIKKQAPNIKWVLSYADACQCGDGTIYRASGFYLTLIKQNNNVYIMPGGEVIHLLTLSAHNTSKSVRDLNKKYNLPEGKFKLSNLKAVGAKPLEGFQIRYIKILDSNYRLLSPPIDYSELENMAAKMYKGKKL